MGNVCFRAKNKADDGTGITEHGRIDPALSFYKSKMKQMEIVDLRMKKDKAAAESLGKLTI